MKKMNTIYTENNWNEFCKKIENDFHIKTYTHLDPFFNFPLEKGKLKKVLLELSKGKGHSFLPFVKILQKTLRYRYQEDEEGYNLETKIRPISYASHFDTYIYAFYSFCLNIKYQEYIHKNGFQEVVLAYRNDLDGKCNIQFANEVFNLAKNKISNEGSCSAIALDIKSYFDNISHNKLKDSWCNIIQESELPKDQFQIFKSLTKYSYINYNSFLKSFNINLAKIKRDQTRKFKNNKIIPKGYQSLFDLMPSDLSRSSFLDKMNLIRKKKLVALNTENNSVLKKRILKKRGIPQGSSMSALLSNIYLADFDKIIFEKSKNEDFHYRRYCDDILIICNSDKVNELIKFIIEIINKEYYLDIQNKKTEVIDFKFFEKNKIRGFKRVFDSNTNMFDPTPINNKNQKNLQYLGFEFNGQNVYIRPGSLSRYFRKMKARISKTISMAYSKKSKSGIINKQQIYSRYTHIGKRNFLSYALNASKESYLNKAGKLMYAMNSPSIKKQISAHMSILKFEIEKSSRQMAIKKRIDCVKS